jgi:8-oxo-dGTP pyrophosphatase MutT (NUDIX family)/GNAT superfamily N-acetyltransferase
MPVSSDPLVLAVRDQVGSRRPVDARERTSIEAFVQQVDQLERPFDETASKVHVTASAIVVGSRGVVLHKHKRLGIWLQPGGHIDAGETPWQAAVRETREETGLPVDDFAEPPPLAHVDVHPGPKGHTHLDLRYVVTAPDAAPRPPAGESQDVKWFRWFEAIDLADAGLAGVLRSLQPGQPVLRPARGGDARECATVYLRSRAFALPTVPVVHDDAEVRRWMADDVIGRADVTVAEVDGTVVGLMVLDVGARGTGWIEQLYLDPAWIGRGLGTRFVDHAKRRHPAGLELWTFEANEPAQRFYAREGFTAVERTDGHGNEERAPDVRYAWSPTSPG